MKVLVVDDVQMARRNIRKVLEREQIEVVEAENGLEAILLYKREKPDVVCLDIDMPELTGLTVLKEIKEVNENANIIMVTGMGSQQNFVESFKGGAKYFLVKPVDLNKLIDMVKSFGKQES